MKGEISRVSENRPLALAICIVCVIISVFGMGGLKLKGEYNAAIESFSADTGDTAADKNHNMEAYLQRCAASAADLSQEAKQYLTDAAGIERVALLSEMLAAEKGADRARHDTYTQLEKAVEDLYSELQMAGKSDEAGVAMAYGDFGSAQDLIKRDMYHEAARAYNKLADSFPASIVAGIWGITEAETFDY